MGIIEDVAYVVILVVRSFLYIQLRFDKVQLVKVQVVIEKYSPFRLGIVKMTAIVKFWVYPSFPNLNEYIVTDSYS